MKIAIKHTIVCGSCKAQGEISVDADGCDRVTCPDCGRNDNVKHALRIIGKHLAETHGNTASRKLTKSMAAMGFVQTGRQGVVKRRPRWIAGKP